MNRVEAQKEFMAGKKVRHESWAFPRYEYLKDGVTHDQDGAIGCPEIFVNSHEYRDGWEVVKEPRCKDFGQPEWVKAEAVPSAWCRNCQFRRRVKRGPKLVRKLVSGDGNNRLGITYKNGGRYCISELTGHPWFCCFVYVDPDDPEEEFSTNSPCVLFDTETKQVVRYLCNADDIINGVIIRLLPVAVIVEE